MLKSITITSIHNKQNTKVFDGVVTVKQEDRQKRIDTPVFKSAKQALYNKDDNNNSSTTISTSGSSTATTSPSKTTKKRKSV